MNRQFSSHKLCCFVKIALDSTCKCINLSLFWELITFLLLLLLNKVFSLHQIKKNTVKMQSRNDKSKVVCEPMLHTPLSLVPIPQLFGFPRGLARGNICTKALSFSNYPWNTFVTSCKKDPFHTIPYLIPIMYHPFATCYTHKAPFNLYLFYKYYP